MLFIRQTWKNDRSKCLKTQKHKDLKLKPHTRYTRYTRYTHKVKRELLLQILVPGFCRPLPLIVAEWLQVRRWPDQSGSRLRLQGGTGEGQATAIRFLTGEAGVLGEVRAMWSHRTANRTSHGREKHEGRCP